MEDILISIIVPVYNVELYLGECIESILNQTHKKLQIILIDDGSTDFSLELCKGYNLLDERILLLHQKNTGVSCARNVGIWHAKGEYIGFVDSDDTIAPTMYEDMLKAIIEQGTTMCVTTKFYYDKVIYDNGTILKNRITKKEGMKELLSQNFPTSLCYSLYHNSLIKQNYLNCNIHYFEDFEYQFRVLDKVTSISICNTPWYYYSKRENSANHQDMNDHVISCLKIADIINKKVAQDYKEFIGLAKKLYPYFLKMTIGYLSKSNYVEEKYFKIITKKTRKYFIHSLFHNDITFFMKIYMFICFFDAKLFWKLYRYIKKSALSKLLNEIRRDM